MYHIVTLWLLVAACLVYAAQAREVTELHGANFELTLTSYKYIAILFYDDSNAGRNMKNSWMVAANDVVLPDDCDMAQVCPTFQAFDHYFLTERLTYNHT